MITISRKIWIEKDENRLRFTDGGSNVLELPIIKGKVQCDLTIPVINDFFVVNMFSDISAREDK